MSVCRSSIFSEMDSTAMDRRITASLASLLRLDILLNDIPATPIEAPATAAAISITGARLSCNSLLHRIFFAGNDRHCSSVEESISATLLLHQLFYLLPILKGVTIHHFPWPRYLFLLCRGREFLPSPCLLFLGFPGLNSARARPVFDLTAIRR